MKIKREDMARLLVLARIHKFEICGLLSCTPDGEPAEIYECMNVASKPDTSYEISADTQFRALKDMEASGTRLAAIYHSHPRSAPVPSFEDIARAFYPVAYIIVGHPHLDAIGEYEARAWSIADGAVSELPIEVI